MREAREASNTAHVPVSLAQRFDRHGFGGLMNLSRLNSRDLEAQARDVEAQIKKLDHRPRPTPSERARATELKKMRLELKDRLGESK